MILSSNSNIFDCTFELIHLLWLTAMTSFLTNDFSEIVDTDMFPIEIDTSNTANEITVWQAARQLIKVCK